MMKLKKFCVTNFRSVADTGWIDADDVTALIGTNEAGKTNILLPLWKLSPAKGGEIIPTADFPRKYYNELRVEKEKPVFIRAIFELDSAFAATVAAAAGVPQEMVTEVEVARDLDGKYAVTFPGVVAKESFPRGEVIAVLQQAATEIDNMVALKSEQELKATLLSTLQTAQASAPAPELDEDAIQTLIELLGNDKLDNAPKSSVIVPRYRQVTDVLQAFRAETMREHPDDVDNATDLVLENLPTFVYYSTYGNLDSEIYLPHVIANLKRTDLGLREAAKARTLKVLFDFVRLQPEEILELGQDFKDPSNPARQPTEDEISAITLKKKERSILLQSASSLLTQRFRDWWKQGEYRFRFEADGNHFRIWVSDDKRPEEIELEGRSTGLQWFLSFYLVFLVERADEHESAILLLDEPGLSLHPLAQRDLSEFFDGLSKDNQLVYTCHSPFLVDADRLDRVRKVYVGADGTSKVTADLRASDENPGQRGSAYAVYAALGLSVAESLLLGCEPIIIEGPSDQHYLTAMKSLLIAAGRLTPNRELVFPPAGGAPGVKAVSSILAGRNEALPVVLFDSDSMGANVAKSLRDGLYAAEPHLILQTDAFAALKDSEVEDLLPPQLLITQLDRWQRSAETPFGEVYKSGTHIVPQIEAWAKAHGVELKKPGWKVELARRVKQQLLQDGFEKLDKDVLERWEKLFSAFKEAREKSVTAVAG